MQSYFDIDSSDYVPNQTLEDYYWAEFKEESGGTNLTNSTRFRLATTNLNAKMRLGKAMLEVQCNVAKADGTSFAENGGLKPRVAPINSAWHMFNGVRATLGTQAIYNSKYPGKEHLIRHLIKYSKEYAKTVGSQNIFYPDTAGDAHDAATVTEVAFATAAAEKGMYQKVVSEGLNVRDAAGTGVSLVTSTSKDNPNYNSGFKKRVDQFVTAGSLKTVSLWLPLSELITFFEDYDRLMTGVRFELELDKNTNYKEALFGHEEANRTSTDPIFNITKLSLWVPIIKEAIEIKPMLTEKFLNSSRSISYRHINSYVSSIRTEGDGAEGSWNITTETAKPLKAYVAYQYADRGANYKFNSAQFDALYSDIWLDVNSEIIPRDTHKGVLATDNDKFSRILQDIYQAGDKDLDSDDSSIITHQNWKKIYPITVFNLEQLGESLFKKSVAHINLHWKKAGADNYRIIFILETERAMKISYGQNKADLMWK